jgi:hypothetical protein
MTDSRPAIPAEIKRRVLVEAGHRCAIPTCRYIEVDIHHIIPWETCKTHEYENLIALCSNCHRRADRGEIDRKALRLYKANLRFAHDKFSNFEMDLLFELYNSPPNTGFQWPPFLMLQVKRIIDAGYIFRQENKQSGIFLNGMKTDPDLLGITESGRQFIQTFGLQEL